MGKKGETGLKTIITEKYKLMKLGENYPYRNDHLVTRL